MSGVDDGRDRALVGSQHDHPVDDREGWMLGRCRHRDLDTVVIGEVEGGTLVLETGAELLQ